MEKIIYYLCLIILSIFAIILLIPMYWMIKGGFENLGSIMKIPPNFVLINPTLQNYAHLFLHFPIFRWMLNSFIVASTVMVVTVFTSCLAGYAFAKKQFVGKDIIFWLLLSSMMIPIHVKIIPLFIMIKEFGLHNTYPGIFLPMCCFIGYMFLARQYMSTIPSELIDSARIDGASELKTFISVILPISNPLVGALCIFTFIGAWNDFLWPLVISSSDATRTLPIGVVGAAATSTDLVNIGIGMAGATLVAIPLVIVFFSFQKYFTKGITLGAVKG